MLLPVRVAFSRAAKQTVRIEIVAASCVDFVFRHLHDPVNNHTDLATAWKRTYFGISTSFGWGVTRGVTAVADK